jgi:hypothetical protein
MGVLAGGARMAERGRGAGVSGARRADESSERARGGGRGRAWSRNSLGQGGREVFLFPFLISIYVSICDFLGAK